LTSAFRLSRDITSLIETWGLCHNYLYETSNIIPQNIQFAKTFEDPVVIDPSSALSLCLATNLPFALTVLLDPITTAECGIQVDGFVGGPGGCTPL
jgi:hypothetical protein